MARNPNDHREPPHCKRCGKPAEPDDFYCWHCSGEQMILKGQVVPHIYLNTTAMTAVVTQGGRKCRV